jgi:hypothetical protein
MPVLFRPQSLRTNGVQPFGGAEDFSSTTCSCEDDAPGDEIHVGSKERIYLLTYAKHTDEFHEALGHDQSLDVCRDTLAAHGYSMWLANRAKIFVHPHQFPAVVATLNSVHLRPHHVIVSEDLVHLVECTVASIRCRARPKLKRVGPRRYGTPIIY